MQKLLIGELGGYLHCQIESFHADSDFAERACLRLIGVLPQHFNAEAFSEGIKAFVIDVPRNKSLNRALRRLCICGKPEDCRRCSSILNGWFRVAFEAYDASNETEPSFIYRCFGTDGPVAVTVTSIKGETGFKPPAFPRLESSTLPCGADEWICSSFSVGQGMASMVYSDKEGYLIDAGAGKPIKRAIYLGNAFANDLSTRVHGRDITFVLSHGDEDHWRILQWDKPLRDSIKQFVIPAGRPRVAFFDVEVKSRVRELDSHAFVQLGKTSTLRLFRTAPVRRTSNNDGIVVLFEREKKRVLIPGDCVYTELKKDGDAAVRALVGLHYDAVVVPHHGDRKSARSVPTAVTYRRSVAYFAAGNHEKYQHPTIRSRINHRAAGYVNVLNKTPTAIVEHVF